MTATASPPRAAEVPVEHLEAAAYTIPTDGPEADGTLSWDSTTMIVVHLEGGGRRGLGWTYGATAVASLISGQLASVVEGADAMQPDRAHDAMRAALRNAGAEGVGAMAISAVDIALWDLKAKLLDLPLCTLLGRRRESVPLYGSGGFTAYSIERLCEQLAGWVEQGIPRVKMKVGSRAEEDPERVRAARQAIGEDSQLFVDGNGAYSRKQALHLAEMFAVQAGVSWFEEPVSSDDLAGLRLLRDRVPGRMSIAAGEYGWNAQYFRRMLEAQAIDVLQADVTRCGGVTGFMQAAALCEGFQIPLSAHCAPGPTRHAALAAERFVHIEWFHDHVRIESMLFDGFPAVEEGGVIRPDLSRPGIGMELKAADAERYRA